MKSMWDSGVSEMCMEFWGNSGEIASYFDHFLLSWNCKMSLVILEELVTRVLEAGN